MRINFVVAKDKEKNPNAIIVGEDYSKCYGTYEMREISAQEGIHAINCLIAQNKEFQENPDKITPEQLRKKQVESATTFDGKPLVIADLAKYPNKLWMILVAAHEKLNSVSLEEARFLLQPSSSAKKQTIQP